MRETKNMKVEFIDDEHIFVNNRQFVSLKRFYEARKEVQEEVKLLTDKNEELAKENEALKTLLKKQLDGVKDSPSTETLVNKMCVSDEDHEWECCGISTIGTDYRCKKCGAHKITKFDYQPLQTFYDSPTLDNIPNCCKACSNHPSNGGSGICNCTAPYFEQNHHFTCTTQTLDELKQGF